MEHPSWIVQGLLIILGTFIAYGWNKLVHRIERLETWQHEAEKDIVALKKNHHV